MGWAPVAVIAGGMFASLTTLAAATGASAFPGITSNILRFVAWLCLGTSLVLAVESGGWGRGLTVWLGLLCLAGPAVAALSLTAGYAAAATAGGLAVAAWALMVVG